MALDPTLTGVIIGGAVGVLGPLLTSLTQVFSHWLTGRREDKKWAREQAGAEGKRTREERQEKLKETREIFQNSLRCLGSLISIEGAEIELAPAEKLQRIEEAHKWLNLLSLHYPLRGNDKVKKFNDEFESFTNNPFQSADEMREATIELANNDDDLFPNAVREIEEKEPEKGVIRFKAVIDDTFRQQQMSNAIELPKSHEFSMRLEDLSESQRTLLANIYFPDFKQIPDVTHLPMPGSPRPNRTHTWGLNWKGSFNPATTAPSEILKMWEADYSEAINKAAG